MRMVELEYLFDRNEEDDRRVDLLTGYTRRIRCGLILNGGFVEGQEPDSMH